MCCPYLCSHCGWLLLKCSAIGIGFNGAETNCRIAHILGIPLMNSCNTDIFFSNYYHWQSVRFELECVVNLEKRWTDGKRFKIIYEAIFVCYCSFFVAFYFSSF